MLHLFCISLLDTIPMLCSSFAHLYGMNSPVPWLKVLRLKQKFLRALRLRFGANLFQQEEICDSCSHIYPFIHYAFII